MTNIEYVYYYHDNGELIPFEDKMHDLRNQELVIETILLIGENRVEITFEKKENQGQSCPSIVSFQ